MKNGQCPKCGSKEVYSGADIPLKSGPFTSNTIPISLTSMAALDNYVCVDCGLVESYIADSSKLEEIAKNWGKVESGVENKK
jgi:predicted nucleic-acid-binding Zn-ribbon protein